MEARQKIRQYMESNLVSFEDGITFSDSDNMFELGFLNSLFAMQLLTFIQNEFDITIDDQDIEIANFSSIDNIMGLIRRKQGAAA